MSDLEQRRAKVEEDLKKLKELRDIIDKEEKLALLNAGKTLYNPYDFLNREFNVYGKKV